MEQASQNPLYKPINARRIIKTVAMFIIGVTVMLYWTDWISNQLDDGTGGEIEATADASSQPTCNVAGIELHGDLVTYVPASGRASDESENVNDETASEDIAHQIEASDADENIEAILLEIDSPGGFPVAAEEVEVALKNAKKPTVALIRESGTSAAYWAATGADYIIASQNSDVASIGVTMSYLDATQKNQREGLRYNELHSGSLKDAGDPDKPLTAEERRLLERDLAIVHENFIKAVAENRKLDINAVRKLADGSSMLGSMALVNKLIDKIGGVEDAKAWLKEKIGEEPEICWRSYTALR